MSEEVIKVREDLRLSVEKKNLPVGLEITFRLKSDRPCTLHWGLTSQSPGKWQSPPSAIWPEGTRAFNQTAVQTPFTKQNGNLQVVIRLNGDQRAPFLVFDLFHPESSRWDNNQGRDFSVVLREPKPAGPAPSELLERELKDVEVVQRKVLKLDSGDELASAVVRKGNRLQLSLLANASAPLLLHWGLTERARTDWRIPPESLRPRGTTVFDDRSVDTPFSELGNCQRLDLHFPEAEAPKGLSFVLRQPDADSWLKHRGQNIFLTLTKSSTPEVEISGLAADIVQAESGEHGWTLMHRFNLCHDQVDSVRGQRDGWATLFVWLRYSAIRQLDWQRNYNTKPRELSHAQDRLTLKLAEAYVHEPPQRDLIRLMLACLGRGGEGQRIRDDILQIMHRHHIKEVGGTWMEQWHQKLHNNTTLDDVIICEAYLAFLRSNGDVNRYYETLGAGGVTRERLAGFDRPINRDPEWHPHLKDGLIHDFENYARLLKSVHSGTDLESAANTGRYLLGGPAHDALGYVQYNFRNESSPAVSLVQRITEVRSQLNGLLKNETNPGRMRDGIYLDLAMEDTLRVVIERAIHSGFSGEQLFELIELTVQNLLLVRDDEELSQCHREWKRLPTGDRFTKDWSLHAKAALDRMRRAIEAGIDQTYQLLQPRAVSLGHAFHAEDWAVDLFSEAVVRGRPAFVLSMLIRDLDPILRKQGHLGDWQVISPNHATGEVLTMETLRELQGRRFERQTVVVAEKVFGDEEPPEGVCAVITPSSVDLVSHVAVRARNDRLLFATCYDHARFDQLKALNGQVIELKVTVSGDVLFQQLGEKVAAAQSVSKVAKVSAPKPNMTARPLLSQDFAPGLVGGKSNHLKELSGKLPEWIRIPRSVALPFGCFDSVLDDKSNRQIAVRFRKLLDQLENHPAEKMAEVRRCLMELELPAGLQTELRQVMQAEHMTLPDDWSAAAERIKHVWASKWNDRACFSRLARGFPHEAMFMAVLIQEVVEAEYAFVIHTVNPFTGKRDELYAEVVPGLGETLVGNYPGRAFSFVSSRKKQEVSVFSYPGKSIGLFGAGLIFRSDSNAEDLEGYAGAGLYDSVLLTPPQERPLDYTRDPLVWDLEFRGGFTNKLTQLGNAVEAAFGGPQDIEGAFVGGTFFVVQSRPQVGL